MIHRLYPPGYTGDSLGILNKLLKEGWKVVRVDTIEYKNSGSKYNDYLLQRKREKL